MNVQQLINEIMEAAGPSGSQKEVYFCHPVYFYHPDYCGSKTDWFDFDSARSDHPKKVIIRLKD